MNINKFPKTLKVLLVLGASCVFALLLCGAILLKPIFFPEKVTLPPIENITKIEIETDYTDPVTISEPEKLHLLEDFINQYPDGWYAPPLVPGVAAKLRFSLYSEDEFIEQYGISKDFTTREYGRFIKSVPEEEIKSFITALSPILEEALYPVIPASPTGIESLPYWEKKLSELSSGTSLDEINEFLIKNDIATTYFYPGGFINVNLYVVNEGDFVDTVIAAQLVLIGDNKLDKVRLFGYELSKKADLKKLSFWEAKLAKLKQGASVEELADFVRENNIVISDCSEGIIRLNLYRVNSHWYDADDNGRLIEIVGMAQFIMDENKTLHRAELLGHKLSEKVDTQPGQIPPTCKLLLRN